MKNLSLIKFLFLALAVSLFYSCGDDGDGNGDFVLGPEISFLDDGNGTYLITDADLSAGESFSVNIRADKGDNELRSITIYEDGLPMEAADVLARVTYDHLTTPNNPQVIDGADVDGLDWVITIVTQEDEGVSTYEFEVTDSADEVASTSLTINTVPVVTTDLGIFLLQGTGCFGSDVIVGASTSFCLSLNGTRGSASALSSITVYENNDVIDASRLDLVENPFTLDAANANGFMEFVINIDSHDAGTSEYRVVLSDADGNTVETGVFVTVGATVSTLTGVLLNSAGPAGTGGLDLDTGTGTGSSDAAAEIRDQGVDLAQPVPQNWIQRISGVNGSEIRSANNLPEGFKFDNVAIQSEIVGAFDSSDPLTNNTSDVINVDDQFVVRNGSNYYYLLVTNVNVTTADNTDSYTFSVKQ